MRDIELLTQDYRLTTAEILYRMPDHQALLQSYIWQEYDIAPTFPMLQRFLEFWERELDGPLHSVKVMSCEIIRPSDCRFVLSEIKVH